MAKAKTKKDDVQKFRCSVCKTLVPSYEMHRLAANMRIVPVDYPKALFRVTNEIQVCNACFNICKRGR